MKVQLINTEFNQVYKKWLEEKGVEFPVLGETYTVREVTHNNQGYLLEEIVNPNVKYSSGKVGEPSFWADRFSILLPDESEIEEIIKFESECVN